ncbi:hypothetical protein PHMEG_00024597 [Phytophthora megakarya]|uniref:DDE-1 domain-containing protein n=1 Tax=Phytophthora megakarya TaxID=4795 RepID=A0A225VE98_9STRA|nr:hypothetical protein PHMEG_00024597 [Phytophthora megakarya]
MGPLKLPLRNTWIQQQGLSPKKAKGKRVDIIKRTIVAWNRISEKTVRKSFVNVFPRQFEAIEFM